MQMRPEDIGPNGTPVIYDRADDGWFTVGIALRVEGDVMVVVPTSDSRAMADCETSRGTEGVLDVRNITPVEPRGVGRMGATPAEMLQRMSEPFPVYARGQVLMEFEEGEPDRARPWVVAEDIELTLSDAGRSDRVVPVLRYEPDRRLDGAPEHLLSGALRQPARIADKIQFFASLPDDDFSLPVFEPLDFPQIPTSEAVLSWGGNALTGVATIVERDGEITYDFLPDDASRRTLDISTFVSHAELAPLDPSARWHATRVHGRVVDSLHKHVTGGIGDLTVKHHDGTPLLTRETFASTRFEAFSHKTLSRNPDVLAALMPMLPNTFNVTVFEREARIFNVLNLERMVGVAYRGGTIDGEQLTSLRLLLGYASGNRSWHASTETFDAERRALSVVRHSYRLSPSGAAPIHIDPWSRTNKPFAEAFGSLLDGVHRMRKDDPDRLVAVLHRYSEGSSSSYPADRLLDMAVAVDALISLVMGTKQKPIVEDKSTFRALRKGFVKTLKLVGRPLGLSNDIIDEFERMLGNLNKPAVGARARAFWKRVGIGLTAVETKALASRTYSVHESLYGDENTPAGLRAKYDLSCVLINLFNRALLFELGWRGKYRSALPGRRYREHALSVGDGQYVAKGVDRKAVRVDAFRPRREPVLFAAARIARVRRSEGDATENSS